MWYFLIVFGFGFLLGTVRVLLLAPTAGDVLAVAIELPVMLILSWFTAQFIVRKMSIPDRVAERLIMGLGAFALLICAEFAIARIFYDRSIMEHLGIYRNTAQIIGLAGQLLFAFIPVILIYRGRSADAF